MILQNHAFLTDCQSMFSHSILDKSSLLHLDSFLVFGGGLSGEAAGRLLQRNGKQVFLVDKTSERKPNTTFESVFPDSLPIDKYPKFQALVKSPGIDPEHPLLLLAREKHIPILSEIYLGRLFFGGTILGITGTDGKSTTTALTHHIIKAMFPKSQVGGNLGLPFTDFCEEDLDLVVLELSSYQLEDSPNLKLKSSAIITLAPDHLERHKTMERYANAKWQIVSHSDKNHTLITQKKVLDMMPKDRTQFVGKQILFGNKEEIEIFEKEFSIKTKNGIYNTRDYKLPGYHNLQNLSVAIALAESIGMKKEVIQNQIGGFMGLPHRFQSITPDVLDESKYRNIQFINDSKSTNLHSMLSGIAGFSGETNLYLILGGDPKNENLDPLFQRLKEINIHVFVYGKAAIVWNEDFQKANLQNIHFVKDIEMALTQIKSILDLEKKSQVILSPAAASFDQYKNFSERGDHFIALVKKYFGKE